MLQGRPVAAWPEQPWRLPASAPEAELLSVTCPGLVVLQPSDSHTAFLPALAQTCDNVAVMQMKRKRPVVCGGWALASNDPQHGSILLQHRNFSLWQQIGHNSKRAGELLT